MQQKFSNSSSQCNGEHFSITLKWWEIKSLRCWPCPGLKLVWKGHSRSSSVPDLSESVKMNFQVNLKPDWKSSTITPQTVATSSEDFRIKQTYIITTLLIVVIHPVYWAEKPRMEALKSAMAK